MNPIPEFPTAAPLRDGAAISRFEEVDREFLQIGQRQGARELQFPTLISKSLLERAEFPNRGPSDRGKRRPNAGRSERSDR
jgi:hypothetical protein